MGHELFDAIITDPPYGVRATSRKTGKNTSDRITSKFELREDMEKRYFEKKAQY